MVRYLFFIVVVHISIEGFGQRASSNTERIQSAVFALSKVMMHDVVSPPAASRYYAYCMMGAYQLVQDSGDGIPSLSAFIREYTIDPSITKGDYDRPLAALYSILEIGRQLLPSGYMLEKDQEELIAAFEKKRISRKVIEESVKKAKEVAAEVIKFTQGDGYNKLSARIRYSPKKEEGYWYPTPPGYMEAVEPNWKTIRTLILDSSNEFVPLRPVAYSRDSSGAFYQLAKEVYITTQQLSDEQLHIAAFWDCNPFALETAGHLSLGFKKISPGGHWMNIAGIACREARLDFRESVMVHTMVGITLMDAFISCWDEKYRSDRIRPETYIHRFIDIRWKPLLQTPPFPEYPSGHSVVSTAVAEVLTYFLGERFGYEDDTELMFEIPSRKFISFRQAAEEASISRLYGGIHFRDAIVEGQKEGRNIGRKIVDRIRDLKVHPLQVAK